MAPTAAKERIVSVDVVRGLALAGIVLVNFQSATLTGPGLANLSGPDRAVNSVIETLLDGKVYPLFSLLFGFGIALQMIRAKARDARFGSFYFRRLTVLFGIGLLHSVFIWPGDILHVYAFWGLLLLPLSRLSNKGLLLVASLLIVLPAVQQPLFNMLRISGTRGLTTVGPNSVLFSSSRYVNFVAAFAGKLRSDGSDPRIYLRLADILGMFLLGLYSGRRGLLERNEKGIKAIQRVMYGSLALVVVSVGAGVGIRLLSRISTPEVAILKTVARISSSGFVYILTTAYRNQALAIFYCSVLLLLLSRAIWLRNLRWLASVGRMALTNYLTQCILAAVVFYGYGLALYGKVGSLAAALMAIGVYLLQIPFSVWWLSRFRFGPVEWIWRSLSYGKAQPMRVSCAR